MRVYVVVATKNRYELLRKAIQSVRDQSYKPYEAIVVSDSNSECYRDEENYLKGLGITLLRDKYTNNYAGNLNTAIEYIISNNEYSFNDSYIAFLDDDDTWCKDYLEKSIRAINGNDFVVSMLSCNKNGNRYKLDLKNDLSLQDFLMGNPGIQGSNTFIRLSTLLMAGCFCESMSSTTDRDLFSRVMMLKPKYSVTNEYLVNIDSGDDRKRITNTSNIKRDGLAKFYYKYHNLMDAGTEDNFFSRAEVKFNMKKDEIENYFLLENVNTDNKKLNIADPIKALLAERHLLLDTLYLNSIVSKAGKKFKDSLLSNGLNLINSSKYMETPLFRSDYSLYNAAALVKSEYRNNFDLWYDSYIYPSTKIKDGFEFLMELAGKYTNIADTPYQAEAKALIAYGLMSRYNILGKSLDSLRVENYLLYKANMNVIFAEYIKTKYRINGLNKALGRNYNENLFNELMIIKGVIMDEIATKGTFDYINHLLTTGFTLNEFNMNKSVILDELGIKDFKELGYGSEGYVFKGDHMIYKWFKDKNDALYPYLRNLEERVKHLKYFYHFKTFMLDGHVMLRYPYVEAYDNDEISYKDIKLVLDDLKANGLVIDNVKLRNFKYDKYGIKYIDYGNSIKEYNHHDYKKSLKRAKQIIENLEFDELNFYKLVNRYYIEG